MNNGIPSKFIIPQNVSWDFAVAARVTEIPEKPNENNITIPIIGIIIKGFGKVTPIAKAIPMIKLACKAAIKEMISEIDGISSVRPILSEELNKVRGGELKGYPAQFEERSSVLGLLSETRREGYQPNWLNLWMTKLNEVTLEQTQKSALQISKSSEYSIIIAGDKAKHLDSIKALKRPIFFYTPDGDLVSSLPSQPAEKE